MLGNGLITLLLLAAKEPRQGCHFQGAVSGILFIYSQVKIFRGILRTS